MLKKTFYRKFPFRSSSEDSNATPTQELQDNWHNANASAISDAEIKGAAHGTNKEVEISHTQRDVDTFGLFSMLLQHYP